MPTAAEPGATYNPTVGLLYIFNLIVGTGALALPKAFQTAGWLLSVIVLLISCLVSYVSATFVIESLSVANAVTAKEKQEQEQVEEYGDVVVSENGPSSFEIIKPIEISQMASIFLGKMGVIFSYVVLNVYLFGDLAIYSTTVPKSLMNLLCASGNASTGNVSLPTTPCHDDWPYFFDRFTVYRICVLAFIVVCTPMVLAGITKTKYIQLTTTLSRWTAFSLMIVLAITSLVEKGAAGHPPTANIHGFGSLFGVTVYAFMCHHSLPGLVTPMQSKAGLFSRLSIVYAVVMVFYFTLSITGAFAFDHVMDVYTLNFLHDDYTSVFYFFCDHFLALFPIFTLTTNYPIVAITLINNVKVLRKMLFHEETTSEEESLLEDNESDQDARPRSRSLRGATSTVSVSDIVIPILTIGLPTIISLSTDNVLLLASVTGSYPGVGVQFIIPCWLVLRAREKARSDLNFPVPRKNASPFQSRIWPIAIFAWACFAIVMVTLNICGFSF